MTVKKFGKLFEKKQAGLQSDRVIDIKNTIMLIQNI